MSGKDAHCQLHPYLWLSEPQRSAWSHSQLTVVLVSKVSHTCMDQARSASDSSDLAVGHAAFGLQTGILPAALCKGFVQLTPCNSSEQVV